MNPLMEPFLYETITGHQTALQQSAPDGEASKTPERPAVRAVCIRMRWCSGAAPTPALWRRLGVDQS